MDIICLFIFSIIYFVFFRAFGARVLSAKAILAQLSSLFELSDNKAREATMELAKELYKFIGAEPLKLCLVDIRSAQKKDLEEYFEKEPSGLVKPTRFTRSALAKAQESQRDDNEEEEEEEMDAFNLIQPVNVMDKINENFFELIESKKWKERQEQIDLLASIVNAPRITPSSDLGKIFRVVKKVIAKDVNMMIVAKAVECVGFFAIGLRNDFTQPAKIMVPPLLERLKEKKPFVLNALHTTLDALYHNSIILSDIIEDICNVITTHKLATVRTETLKFLLRSLKEPSKRLKGKSPVSKNDVKLIARACIQAMDDSSGDVRDLAAETLGTLTGIVGERVTQPYLAKLDGVRLKKVKSCIPEQVTPVVLPEKIIISKKELETMANKKQPASSASRLSGTPKKPTATKRVQTKPVSSSPARSGNARVVKPVRGGSSLSKPTKPTSSSASASSSSTQQQKKPQTSNSQSSKPQTSTKPKQPSIPVPQNDIDSFDYKRLLSEEEAQVDIEELLTETVIEQVNDRQWQTRQSGVEIICKMVNRLIDDNQLVKYSDILVRQLISKPGFKETNFNVMNCVFDVLILIIKSNSKLSKGAAAEIIEGSTLKLADVKSKTQANDCLTSLVENSSISERFVIDHVVKHSIGHRNPKIIIESLAWIENTISDYGIFDLDIRSIVNFCKDSYQNTNPHVRTNATNLLVLLRRYVGPAVRDLLKDVKSAILVTIDKEFEKVASLPAITPNKKLSTTQKQSQTSVTQNVTDSTNDNRAPSKEENPIDEQKSFSKSITTDLLDQLHDKDWKERKQGLIFVQTLLHRYSKIPLSTSLLHALTERLGENNGSLLLLTLNIFESLIPAVGSIIEKNLSFVPGLLKCLGDSKKPIVSSALHCLEILSKQVPMKSLIEFFPPAMETPAGLQILQFLIQESSNCDSSSLEQLILPTLNELTNRSQEVRQAATSFTNILITKLSYEDIFGQTKNLRPAIQKNVIASLEKLAPPRSNNTQTTQNKQQQHQDVPVQQSSSTSSSTQKKQQDNPPQANVQHVDKNMNEQVDDDHSKDFISKQTFDEWCKILQSKKSSRCIQVLKLVCSNIEQDHIPIADADTLIFQLHQLTNYIFKENPINVRFCKYILRTWQVIFSKKLFINAISVKPLKSIIRQILLELQNEQLSVMGENGKQIVQALYNAVLLILNNYDRSDVIVLFLELLHSSLVESTHDEKYIECLVKCLLKLAKTLGATIHTLDLEKILIGLNDFFSNTPKHDELSSKPHRMIKTILNEIVRLEGAKLQKHLDNAIPDNQDQAPVCVYAQQFFQAQQQSGIHSSSSSSSSDSNESKNNTNQESVDESPSSSLSVEDKQKLLEIFKKVRSKDPKQTDSALMELYQFQKLNPSINFAPFLERTSKPFRDFITESLDKIKNQEESPKSNESNNNIPAVVENQISSKPKVINSNIPSPQLQRQQTTRDADGDVDMDLQNTTIPKKITPDRSKENTGKIIIFFYFLNF